MKKIFLILITFFSNNYYISGAGAVSSVISDALPMVTLPADIIIAAVTGNASILQCTVGSSYNAYLECISQALVPGSTGSAAVNNITSITPPAAPGSTPSHCYYDIKGTNPFFASTGSACKTPAPQCCYENPKPAGCTGCTMDCLIASAVSALAAGVLPILGLTVSGNKIGRIYPVEVDVFLNAGSNSSGAEVYTSSVLTNRACVASGGSCPCPSYPFSSGNISDLKSSCGTLAPFYTYITNCLEEGKTDTGTYGREYNNKVFFNNNGATFIGKQGEQQSVNPIQCMACSTGSISSCTVVNDPNNKWPACFVPNPPAPTPAPTPITPSEPSEQPQQYGPETPPLGMIGL